MRYKEDEHRDKLTWVPPICPRCGGPAVHIRTATTERYQCDARPNCGYDYERDIPRAIDDRWVASESEVEP